MSTVEPSLIGGFHRALERWPEATALEIADRSWTYRELSELAGGLARALGPRGGQRVGVYANRSLTAYAASLAVFAADGTHVAVNPSHPLPRCASILAQADVRVLIVGPEAEAGLDELLALHPVETVLRLDEVAPAPLPTCEPDPDELAYIVFTSGSTGAPKGVPISHANLACYLRNLRSFAAPTEDDRVATTYELTFDIALHDMFNTWLSGATLCVVPARQLVAPARFLKKQRITIWFSVASVAMLMGRQGTLRPGTFPDVRISMLCGEPLPAESADAWAAACPNSVLYNVYGPTETTMELAFYRWEADSSARSRRGVAPIGIPFDDHRHLLVDPEGRVVEGAGRGELVLSGPQVARGYWKLPEKTAASFVQLEGQEGTWYRTGDLIERDEAGMYHFVSRLDFQIKLRGHRIELGEIEAALREVAGTPLVAVIPWPVTGGNAQGLVGFVSGGDVDEDTLRAGLRERLPAAMVPDRLERLADLPLNANRKIDRGALAKSLG